MAAGNTATIDIAAFRASWAQHVPIRLMCDCWTVTRDQMTRLKVVWSLPPRHDRALRQKPEREKPVSAEEEAASLAGLALAPAVAARVTVVQARWTPREWHERQVTKPTGFSLQVVETPDEAREFLDAWNRDVER